MRSVTASHSPASRIGIPDVHRSAFPINPIPLRDLCVMLSPFAWLSHRKPRRSPQRFPPQSHPPSVASVTSVRCFPRLPGSRTGSPDVHRSAFPTNPIPLCDLRDLCAMLSPFRLFLAPEAQMSTKALLPPIPSVTSIPLCDLLPS
jgi:hypothetical protein